MKKITREKTVLLVSDFHSMREASKKLDTAMATIRAELMAALGEDSSALVGDFILLVSEKTRTDLDKAALQSELGERLKEFQKRSTYKTLEVKKA